MQGTGSSNSVCPPSKAGTRASACAQRKLVVVEAQRSGSPNSSTSRSRLAGSYGRLDGSTVITTVSAIVNTGSRGRR